MNLIFLDVDGVLNSITNLVKVCNETHKSYSGYEYPFDPICLENFKKLVTITNSKLVISSTWKKSEEDRKKLLEILKEYDLAQQVIGYTPTLGTSRGAEIKEFLSNFQSDSKPNFVILDDSSDMDDLLPYLVKTDIQVGLTDENIQQAIKILNKSLIKEHDEFEL